MVKVYKQSQYESKTWNRWNECGFKKFETIDKEKLSDLL